MLTVGRKGIFTVNQPYVLPPIEYEVLAVQSISAMLELGMDPYELIYAPYGFDRAFYSTVPRGEQVYLLRSSGDLRYLPITAIAHIDETSYVNYADQAIILQVGAHPQGTQFAGFLKELQTVTQDSLGIAPVIQVRNISKSMQVPLNDHSVIQTERAALRSKAITVDDAGARELENKALRLKISALEQFLTRYAESCVSDNCLCVATEVNYAEDVVFYQYSLADYLLQADRGDQHDLPMNNAFIQRLHFQQTPYIELYLNA